MYFQIYFFYFLIEKIDKKIVRVYLLISFSYEEIYFL